MRRRPITHISEVRLAHPLKDSKPGAALIELKTIDGMVMGLGDKTDGELMKN